MWVCADALVARWPFGGFSWGEVGYAFHDVAPARAVASVGGVTFVTFLAVALNAFLADLDRRARSVARGYVRAQAGIAVIAAVVVVRDRHPGRAARDRHRCASRSSRATTRTATSPTPRCRPTTCPDSHFDLAAADHRSRRPDRVPRVEHEHLRPTPTRGPTPTSRANLTAIARQHARLGARQRHRRRAARTAHKLLEPRRAVRPRRARSQGTYAKRHLVPFGESVPFRAALQHVVEARSSRCRATSNPGTRPGLFTVAGVRIGTLICFESAFGYQVRPLVRDGAQVIVLSTNNRSYRRSANSAQHLAIGQMRAAETGPARRAGGDLGHHRGDRRRRRGPRPHAAVRADRGADHGRGDGRGDAVRALRGVGDPALPASRSRWRSRSRSLTTVRLRRRPRP